jgi:hypothetical protein
VTYFEIYNEHCIQESHRKRERSETTDLPSHSACAQLPCASMYEKSHWPEQTSSDGYVEFNCLLYEMTDGAHVAVSADVMGIYGNGNSAAESVNEFCSAVKTRLEDKLGGIYPGTSDFAYQEKEFSDLESEWEADGVTIHQRRHVSVNVCTGAVTNESFSRSNPQIVRYGSIDHQHTTTTS